VIKATGLFARHLTNLGPDTLTRSAGHDLGSSPFQHTIFASIPCCSAILLGGLFEIRSRRHTLPPLSPTTPSSSPRNPLPALAALTPSSRISFLYYITSPAIPSTFYLQPHSQTHRARLPRREQTAIVDIVFENPAQRMNNFLSPSGFRGGRSALHNSC